MPDHRYNIETEQEDDGRWIAEISDLLGVMAYDHREIERLLLSKPWQSVSQTRSMNRQRLAGLKSR